MLAREGQTAQRSAALKLDITNSVYKPELVNCIPSRLLLPLAPISWPIRAWPCMCSTHSSALQKIEHIQFMHRLVYECEVKGAAKKLEIHKHMNTTVQNPSTGQPTHIIYYTIITNVPYLDR
jgi:hypothetical protein